MSVVLPALNEAQTVGHVVRRLRETGIAGDSEIELREIIVIDSDSTDGTAEAAARAGARVVNWRDAGLALEPIPGKGEAIWRGVAAASGDVVVFIDADLKDVEEGIVDKLAAPFRDPRYQLTKARYVRTYQGTPGEGGRVTELCAKPLLATLFPELTDIAQPLAGEFAARREVLESISIVGGYGVDVGLLIDVSQRYGREAIVQVDLRDKVHRNRPLAQLGPMAEIVARTILARAGTPKVSVEERPPLRTLV